MLVPIWHGKGCSVHLLTAEQTFSGTVLSEAADLAQDIINLVGRPIPLAQVAGQVLTDLLEIIETDTMKLYCCPEEDSKRWTNCDWHGEPGECDDNHCPEVRAVQLTDSYFGAGDTCGLRLERVRVFCCDPVEGEKLFLPVAANEDQKVHREFEVTTAKLSAGMEGVSHAVLSEYLDRHIDGGFERFVDEYFEGTYFLTEIL